MYKETPHAKQGDVGSKLAGEEATVEWTAGQEVTVAWTIQVILLLPGLYRSFFHLWLLTCSVLMVFALALEGCEAVRLEANEWCYIIYSIYAMQ